MSEVNLSGISSNIRHKPGCTTNEDDFRLDFSVVMKKRDCTMHVAKTKKLFGYCAANLRIWFRNE